MNIQTETFLALRYLKPKWNANSVITVLSLLGVVVGVMVLIVVLAVMTGMTQKQENDLLATISHVQITAMKEGDPIENVKSVVDIVKSCGVSAAPIIETSCVVQIRKFFDYQTILGVDDAILTTPLNVRNKLFMGKYNLANKGIVISSNMARSYGLRIGDKLNLHSPVKLGKLIHNYQKKAKSETKSANYQPFSCTVTGIYFANLYDKNYIYMNINTAADFINHNEGTATMIYTRYQKPNDIEGVEKKLAEKLPTLKVQSWKKVHKEWLDVLAMEKTMMTFLLSFVILVAAFSITNTLITVTIQKTREIGLLKSIGANASSIMRIFILQGFLIGVIGTTIGVGSGLAVIHFRNTLINSVSSMLDSLGITADFYFLNNMPAKVLTQDIVVVASMAVILCTLGALIPAWRASKLDPANALRYE